MNWKTCGVHGPDSPNAWGCPECLRGLREENRRLTRVLGAAVGLVRSQAWTEVRVAGRELERALREGGYVP